MQVAAGVRPVTSAGVGRWTLAGFALYVVLGLGTMFVASWIAPIFLTPAGLVDQAGTVGLSIRNAIHPIVWGIGVAGLAVPIGRRLVAGLRFGLDGVLVLAIGLALAALTTFLLAEWVRARYGMFDPEYAGLAIFAPSAIVAVAVGAWAAMSVPREHRRPLLLAVGAAEAGFAISLGPSIVGIAGGVAPDGLALAAGMIGSAAFMVLALVLVRR